MERSQTADQRRLAALEDEVQRLRRQVRVQDLMTMRFGR